ncbi:murein biosynthesis integral membrane protein MurJ [Microbacterium rhizomatis]|uniref:Murein biosynthesis integral membrane protein MurJ n=1 Tax=Microbacterium rhizomatis TaxID=1631477 RepID=A0A5J5IXQ4_9MICO|nr:murein biosynthesis integral membrane protein MurJ [Microbacterium rhizomatis]KAA9106271.1 murein biosynthesis integral membrane protein MurJ [Microbacterium rhizomatis]
MSSLGRASVIIGAGTLVSRVTGLLRTIVLVAAIGAVGKASDAFTVANTLPNSIFAIISTGLLTAVIVPQIVRVSADPDGGRAFISKLFTLGTVVLIVTAAIATAASPWLVQLYAPDFTADQLALGTAFAYWCMPQILFYGLYALLGETLNARRIFTPFTWAPIVNNFVSIAGFVLFIVLFGSDRSGLEGWTPEMVTVLGGTATVGIVVQAGVLMLFWRRTGIHVRPDFRWRGVGLNQIGRLAGWTFLMVIAGQLAGLVQSRVVSAASGGNAAQTVMGNAWLIFMLPYSIIVLSIGTAYFTQLSEHAVAGRHDEVRGDVARSIRTLGVFLVGGTAALAVTAIPASRIFTNNRADAAAAAEVLLCFLVALVPLAVLFVVQRTFYAYNDTRTPFFFTLLQCVLVVVSAWIAAAVFPPQHLAAGIALGQSFASIVQVIVATWLLNRRLGGIAVGSWMRALVRFAIAALPAAGVGWLTFVLLGGIEGWMVSSTVLAVVGTMIVGGVSMLVYIGFLALLRAPELEPALDLVRRRLPGRR